MAKVGPHWDGNPLLDISAPDSVSGHDASAYLGRDAVFGINACSSAAINVIDRDRTGTAVSGRSWGGAGTTTPDGPGKAPLPR